ncbi:werner syndrome-like exonuclease-like [Trifolium medium]|uniref:Werner syndrome-like exonuclease-like n=1 Tax=Trifolium medium TaxID=97028 RepID=A0A392MNC9_9FABA|nr:werner syndrome-like exonuclease-like [Trifolium medium]
MGYTEVKSIELNGLEIKTTLTDEAKSIDDHISSFFSPTNNNGTKVIGFDVEWPIEYKDSTDYLFKRANFQLCDGNSCLIICLPFSSDVVPKSLHNFLRMPNYTFVGIGIIDNLAFLEKEHGIVFRNAVELGPLAASLMKMPHLSYCGVDELASVVCKLDLRKYRPSSLDFSWGKYYLNEELVKHATVNVYSYHKIGSALLCTAPIPQMPVFIRRLLILFSVLIVYSFCRTFGRILSVIVDVVWFFVAKMM